HPITRFIHRTFACCHSGERPGIVHLLPSASSESHTDSITSSPASSYSAFIPSGKMRQQSIGASWYGQLTWLIVTTNPPGRFARATSRIQTQILRTCSITWPEKTRSYAPSGMGNEYSE